MSKKEDVATAEVIETAADEVVEDAAEDAATETVKDQKKAEKKAEKKKDPLEELVTINLFKDSDKYSHDVIVCLNGKNWQIKRGVDVQVPLKVKLILDESQAQRARAAQVDEEAQSLYEERKEQL